MRSSALQASHLPFRVRRLDLTGCESLTTTLALVDPSVLTVVLNWTDVPCPLADLIPHLAKVKSFSFEVTTQEFDYLYSALVSQISCSDM
jgi:hypothetical protein